MGLPQRPQPGLTRFHGHPRGVGSDDASLLFTTEPAQRHRLAPANQVVGTDNLTHFEQVCARAKGALRNAPAACDDAKDVTRLLRSERDSLQEFRSLVDKQEPACTCAWIEPYDMPDPEDIGPGATCRSGYDGPDLVHYAYIDDAELTFGSLLAPAIRSTRMAARPPQPPPFGLRDSGLGSGLGNAGAARSRDAPWGASQFVAGRQPARQAVASGILPDVEDGILPPEPGVHLAGGRREVQHARVSAPFVPPGRMPAATPVATNRDALACASGANARLTIRRALTFSRP